MTPSLRLPPSELELSRAAAARTVSLFAQDVQGARAALEARVRGRAVLAVGGAGSIGAATLLQLAGLGPGRLVVMDPSENGLAELVRRVRSDAALHACPLEAVPLDYGAPLAGRFLGQGPRFDVVLVFAALKHVRSERDAFSTARMLEVNLLAADRFLAALRVGGHGSEGVFLVSTDKAVRPASVMGASKRAMEGLLWAHTHPGPASLLGGDPAPPLPRATTARFANVLFSQGSITAAFLQRLACRQALAAPGDVRRWFLTPEEAGQLCTLAALVAPHRHLLVPDLAREEPLLLVELAERVLRAHGLEPVRYDDPLAAREAVTPELARGRYPLLVTRTDTPGEKEREELSGPGEVVLDCGLRGARAVQGAELERERLAALLREVARAVGEAGVSGAGERLLAALRAAVPDFVPADGRGGLDAKM